MTAQVQITQSMLSELVAIARRAGEAILAIYQAPETANIQTKSDNSPITAADLAAHYLIARALPKLLNVPMISEESALPSVSERQTWPAYWLIDPLDGTQEFIARNGQFTVNIALVVAGVPLLGVVHIPVTDETYLGLDKSIALDGLTRAEKYRGGLFNQPLKTRTLADRFAQGLPLDILMSLRHSNDVTQVMLENIAKHWPAPLRPISAGSSLKFCKIAEGEADFYPRLAPTCEWDTAAAQAVLSAAGGCVVRADNYEALSCNSAESILNPSFLAWGDATYPWQGLLEG